MKSMAPRTQILSKKPKKVSEHLNQGDCIHLINKEDLFQVIGIDSKHKKCWVRRWPMRPDGSPVFEISFQQVKLD